MALKVIGIMLGLSYGAIHFAYLGWSWSNQHAPLAGLLAVSVILLVLYVNETARKRTSYGWAGISVGYGLPIFALGVNVMILAYVFLTFAG